MGTNKGHYEPCWIVEVDDKGNRLSEPRRPYEEVFQKMERYDEELALLRAKNARYEAALTEIANKPVSVFGDLVDFAAHGVKQFIGLGRFAESERHHHRRVAIVQAARRDLRRDAGLDDIPIEPGVMSA